MRPPECAVSWRARDDEVAKSVVRVRVVDDYREGLAGIDGLKAAGHRLETRNERDKISEGNSSRMRSCERRKQVEDVDFAGEMRADAC